MTVGEVLFMLSRKTPLRSKKKAPGKRKKQETYIPFIDKQTPRAARGPERIPLMVRRHVLERDGRCCQNCRHRGTQLHHITFRKMGGGHGKHVPENLVLLCHGCHQGRDGPHQRHDKRLYWETWAAHKYGLTLEQWYQTSIGKRPSSWQPTQSRGTTQDGERPDVSHRDCPQDRQSRADCAE